MPPPTTETQEPRAAPLSPEGYRTSPDHETTGWPPGVPYIIGNEACERFSYYGMRAILVLHLASLYVIAGETLTVANQMATATTHLFFAGVYALPMIGAIIADRLAGKYKTILYLSLVYCAGHAVLAVGENSLLGMYIGLGLIAVGSGGIKPCVSANVGDQFGKNNWFRVRTVYQVFYFSINFGSFFATLLIPLTKEYLGASVAFGIPGVLMFIATLIFWLGRRKFVHVPPRPGGTIGLLDTLSSTCLFLTVGHFFFSSPLLEPYGWWRPTVQAHLTVFFLATGLYLFSKRQQRRPDDGFLAITLYALKQWLRGGAAPAPADPPAEAPLARSRFWGPAVRRYGLEATEGPVAVFKIVSVFFLISIFWALFDQHSSTWILQAATMDLTLWEGFTIKAAQTAATNPLFVMLFIPLMNLVYRAFDRMGMETTPLRRITVGMFFAALSFVAVAIIQMWIDAAGPGQVWVVWQVVPYVLVTIAEVMVSITGLEFAYTQAPKRMKSTVMGFWLLAVSLGNVLVAFLAGFKDLSAANFFWVFAGLSAAAGVIFGLRAYFYVPRDYRQE